MTNQIAEKKVRTKKKKQKKLTPVVKLICFAMIGIAFGLLWQVGKDVYTTVRLKRAYAEAQEKFQKIKDENTYLTTEKEKLTNPDYVQSYARGNYMLSKEGEQIFYLPEVKEK